MTKYPDPPQGIEASSDTPSPSTGEGACHLEQIHHVIHPDSLQNPTEVNMDTATMASPSGEEHIVPSNSFQLIQEYVNLRTSGLRQSKIIQYRDKREKGIPKLCSLIFLFASVAMSATNSILPETASFAANILHHEERAKSYTENLPNFTNPLVSNIKSGNYTFTFKEATSQPDRMEFV